MGRTVEEIFRSAYHVGERYERFKILIVTEGGPDFSASQEANNAAFRKILQRSDVHRILDTFDEAVAELELPLGESDREEFFATYNYYWDNNQHAEILSGKNIDRAAYLTRVVDELGAGLIVGITVGDERFRREYFFDDDELSERPIFTANNLKEIFKRYLPTCYSGIDETFDCLANQIAEGKSPLDDFDDFCANVSGGGTFNTFPLGEPSGLHPDLLVVCEDPMNLAEPFGFRYWHGEGAFNYIDRWCHETQHRFRARRVKLLTDKWTTEAYKRYENLFRRFAKHGVKFEFYLYTLGARPVKINLPF